MPTNPREASSAGGSPSTEKRGYASNKDAVERRVQRIEGQVRGINRMIDEDRYCIEVVTQITAVQAALDRVALDLLTDHATHCVLDAPQGKAEERTEELVGAFRRLMRRG